MKTRFLLAARLLFATACTTPAPPPSGCDGGTYVGAFQFTASLVAPGADAGALGGLATSCSFGVDAGFQPPAETLTFFAYVSEVPATGQICWQIPGGPVESGTLSGSAMVVSVESCAPIAGCGCVASVSERVSLQQVLPDGGTPAALTVPVLQLEGWVDDTLSASPAVGADAGCVDAGATESLCNGDAGPGCGLGAEGSCDIAYTVVGTPGLPGS